MAETGKMFMSSSVWKTYPLSMILMHSPTGVEKGSGMYSMPVGEQYIYALHYYTFCDDFFFNYEKNY